MEKENICKFVFSGRLCILIFLHFDIIIAMVGFKVTVGMATMHGSEVRSIIFVCRMAALFDF